LVETRNFGRKSKFWSKLEILVETRNFGPNLKFWPKLEILAETRNFGRNSKFWSRLPIMVQIKTKKLVILKDTNEIDVFLLQIITQKSGKTGVGNTLPVSYSMVHIKESICFRPQMNTFQKNLLFSVFAQNITRFRI